MADGCGANICHRQTSGQPPRPHYLYHRFSPAIIKVVIFCTGFLSCHILHNQVDIQVSSPSLVGVGGEDVTGSVKTNGNVTLCEEEKAKKILSRESDGVEKLPPGIIERTSDFYLRRLWGNPEEDLQYRQRGLLAMTAGIGQKANVDLIISKFPAHMFSLIIFHYDNILDEWQGSEWSDRAIHVAAKGQTKWWFTKRFLTPNVVSAYDYIFIWDEDVTVDDFNGIRYMEIMDKYKLEISQPALGGASKVHYPFTRHVDDVEVHFRTDLSHKGFDCSGGNVHTPCAGFVEVMVPVFATSVWTCVWHMLQNDLVHCWGVDFRLGECTNGPRHEKIAVVDSEWIVHTGVEILGKTQGDGGNVCVSNMQA